MFKFLLDFIYPKHCAGCNKVGTYFCPDCIKRIYQADLVCPFCEKRSIGGLVHPVCIRKYGLDGLWSLGIYQNPLKKAIQKLKYQKVSDLASTLVDITVEYWIKHQPLVLDQIIKDRGKNWIITPVPLFWKRSNWRGFNQSALLSQLLSKKLGLKYVEALKRVKNTKSQVGLESGERKTNIKNAFVLNPEIKITDKTILLIDDVWTTGSTLKECCFILKRAGAKKVWAITLAR